MSMGLIQTDRSKTSSGGFAKEDIQFMSNISWLLCNSYTVTFHFGPHSLDLVVKGLSDFGRCLLKKLRLRWKIGLILTSVSMGLKWFAPNKVGSESILPNKDMNADTRLPIMMIDNPIEILILKKLKLI